MDRIADQWQQSEVLNLPGLRCEISRGRLMQLVFETAEQEGWHNTAAADAEVSSTVLRSMILYALAIDLGSSEEVVENAITHPALAYLSSHRIPEWRSVHEFRRRNAALLQRALVDLISRAVPAASWRTCWIAAQERLRRAIQADSIVLDV